MKLLALSMLAGSAAAMPLYLNESDYERQGLFLSPNLQYEQKVDIQPGFQWNDAGGYCGSWSTQRAALGKGAWLSQQQVRDATEPCGGNDNEILSCNIEEALTNLKMDFEGFDYVNTPTPQQDPYAKWLKKQLLDGHVVAWMIMWSGQSYPIYNLVPPAGMYGHVEPVIGIQSNYPLNDTTVYDDDVLLHFTDGGINTVHRPIKSIAGSWGGVGQKADCGKYSYCIGNPYGFGWAIKGFSASEDSKAAQAAPALLHIEPSLSEPDTRSGEKPEPLTGTLNVSELKVGESYDIYRWGSTKEAFTYTDTYKKTTFQATSDTYVYVDDTTFPSDSATYYRVVPSKA